MSSDQVLTKQSSKLEEAILQCKGAWTTQEVTASAHGDQVSSADLASHQGCGQIAPASIPLNLRGIHVESKAVKS